MKKLFILFAGLFFPVYLFSQPAIEWQKALGGTESEEAYSIQQTADSGYIVAGYTYSNDSNVSGSNGLETDYWIVKLDISGNLQWQKCLGGTNAERANSIHQTSDKGYIIGGSSSSIDGDV